MDSTKTIQVNIPSEIQEKINAEEYKRKGNVVRDKQGQIVCHLDSLDVEDGHYFSPSIFVSVQNYAITSVSVVSVRLQNDLKEIRASYASINGKLDRILGNQSDGLIASITNFEEHFSSLSEKCALTDEKATFTAGTEAASKLAPSIKRYIDDYVGSTIVFYDRGPYKGETYSSYLETQNQEYPPKIIKSKFSNFANSEAYYFVYSFINIINNINILSLCYNSKAYPRYEENLTQVRSQMVELLSRLMHGIGHEGDIYGMCYSTNEQSKFRPIQNLDKLLKYSGTDIHQVIQRSYETCVRVNFDEERISSIYTIIRLIDDIENLLKRNEQISEVELKGLPELAQIKKLLFIEK
jgi:hypothetical protein